MINLAYCDYIAHVIKQNLKPLDTEGLIGAVGKVQFDLTPTGEFCSTTKTLWVADKNGKQYLITIQEA
jgi:hypothetical protein